MEDELTMLSTLYTRYSLRPLRLADGAPVGITVSLPSSPAQSDTRWENRVSVGFPMRYFNSLSSRLGRLRKIFGSFLLGQFSIWNMDSRFSVMDVHRR